MADESTPADLTPEAIMSHAARLTCRVAEQAEIISQMGYVVNNCPDNLGASLLAEVALCATQMKQRASNAMLV